MSTRSRVRVVAAALAVATTAPMVLAQGRPTQPPQPPPTGRSTRPIVLAPPAVPGARGSSADVEEVTVRADSVIGIRLETTLDSEHAKLEDPVTARVTRDVNVKGRTAIPAGARMEGYVSEITRGPERSPAAGKPAADRAPAARIGLKFTTLVLNDGKLRLPIQTETVFRSAEATAGQTATRVGAGVVVGAILGAAIGGRKGALIGGSAGAAGGAVAAAAGNPDRSDVTIAAGTTLTVRLIDALTLLVERTPASR